MLVLASLYCALQAVCNVLHIKHRACICLCRSFSLHRCWYEGLNFDSSLSSSLLVSCYCPYFRVMLTWQLWHWGAGQLITVSVKEFYRGQQWFINCGINRNTILIIHIFKLFWFEINMGFFFILFLRLSRFLHITISVSEPICFVLVQVHVD